MVVFNALLGLCVLAGLLLRSGVDLAMGPAASVTPHAARAVSGLGVPEDSGLILVPWKARGNEESRHNASSGLWPLPGIDHQAAAGRAAALASPGTALGASPLEVGGLMATFGFFAEPGIRGLRRFRQTSLPWLWKSIGNPVQKLIGHPQGAGRVRGSKGSVVSKPHIRLHPPNVPHPSDGGVHTLLAQLPAWSVANLDLVVAACELLSCLMHLAVPAPPAERLLQVLEVPASVPSLAESVTALSMPDALVCATLIVAACFGMGAGLAFGTMLAVHSACSNTANHCALPRRVEVHPLSSLVYYPQDRRYDEGVSTPHTVSTVLSAKTWSSARYGL